MRIRNYTSSVPVESTLTAIERRLVEFGATNIAKQFEAGEIASLVFTIVERSTQLPLTIRIPAKVEKIQAKLTEGKKRLTDRQKHGYRQQARRTAWKLMQDWIDLQLTMIALEQADLVQVFLPYVMMSPTQTFYDRIAESQFKALTDQRASRDN